MPLSDVDLLCAAQAAPANDKAIRNEFIARFGGFLRHAAGNQCSVRGISQASEIRAVMHDAVAMVFNPDIARFDPMRSAHWKAYLQGLVNNAAKSHAQFLYEGDERRHDWGSQETRERDLPQRIEDVIGRSLMMVDATQRDLVQAVIRLADADESVLIARHFFGDESMEDIARSIGVDRTTVNRRLRRFLKRVRALLSTNA